MVTPATIPVFLNGRPVTVPLGATLAALVAQVDPELATALAAGQARATDARDLPVAADLVLSAGAIFRVSKSSRAAAGPADA